MTKKKAVLFMFIFTVLGLLVIGGTSAYLTDHTETVNEFTVGKVSISLLEPNWSEKDYLKLEPKDVVKKDPQIKNTGTNDAFVYLEVQMPVRTVRVSSADGTSVSKINTELFSYTAANSWTLIDTRTSGSCRVYTYCYNSVLASGKTTKALFDSMKFINIVEGEMDTQQISVPIRAYAIQTENTGNSKKMIVEQAKAAFKKYYNQNIGQSGAAKALLG